MLLPVPPSSTQTTLKPCPGEVDQPPHSSQNFDPVGDDLSKKDLISGARLFSIILWCVLVVFALQALQFNAIWPFAWILLGAATMILRHYCKVSYLLIIEAPIFYAIIAYSSSVLFLISRQDLFDLEHDPRLNDAGWVAFFAIASFSIGMAIPLLRMNKKQSDQNARIEVGEREAIKLVVFGFLSTEVLMPFCPGSLRVFFIVFGLSMPLGLFMLLMIYSKLKIPWMGTLRFYIWLPVFCFWALRSVSGGIFGSTLLLLALFFAQHVRSKIILFSFIAACIIVAPLLQDTKDEYRQKFTTEAVSSNLKLKEAFLTNFKKVFLDGDLESYLRGITSLASRVCTFGVWVEVKNHMDNLQDFAHGSTIIGVIVTSLIPRILWSDKPDTGGINDLAEKYADMSILPGTSVSIGPISEFYVNGGLMYLLPGMFLLGLMGAYVLIRGYCDRVQPLGYLMGILTFAVFVRPESSLADTLGPFLRIIFLWMILRYWLVRKNRKQQLMLARMKK